MHVRRLTLKAVIATSAAVLAVGITPAVVQAAVTPTPAAARPAC